MELNSIAELSSRLEAAMLALVGAHRIKERLLTAYTMHLAGLDCSLLPDELAADFRTVEEALHRVRAAPGTEVVRASLGRLSDMEAAQLAQRLVHLYAGVLTLKSTQPLGPRAAVLPDASALSNLLALNVALGS